MFTELTTVPCTADKGDHEGADSKAVRLASRVPDRLHFQQVVPTRGPNRYGPQWGTKETLCHPATVAERQRASPPSARLVR